MVKESAMPNSALFDVVFRAADDREFREMLVADPNGVGRAYRLDVEERLVIRGMAKYAFVPGRSTAFDRDEFSDLLLLFLKLAISDALNDPDAISALGDIAQELKERANDLEAERLKVIADAKTTAAKEKGAACQQSLHALAYAALMVMAIVLLELLSGTPDDPPD